MENPKCPTCGREMRLLFVHYSCDYCEGKADQVDADYELTEQDWQDIEKAPGVIGGFGKAFGLNKYKRK